MELIDYIGTKVQQGGSRRSALYGSLKWNHEEIQSFMNSKNWSNEIIDQKLADYNFKAPLDCTNISVSYDANWLVQSEDRESNAWKIFKENVRLALLHGEPGFSFNLKNPYENLRNACAESVSGDDSDVCNLGSINLARVKSINDFKRSTELALLFLMCGSIRSELPNAKVAEVRKKNNRVGVGLMGIHEFLIQRHRAYGACDELEEILYHYKEITNGTKERYAKKLRCTIPIATRAVAPTGSVAIVAGTTSGIEPIFAKAYKRRYLKGNSWHYRYIIDSTAKRMIDMYPHAFIQSAHDLSISTRLDMINLIESYVDQGVSSTINLPEAITDDTEVERVANFIRDKVKRNENIRGLTFYPNGARGSIFEEVVYEEALRFEDVEFKEHDICSIAGKGSCG